MYSHSSFVLHVMMKRRADRVAAEMAADMAATRRAPMIIQCIFSSFSPLSPIVSQMPMITDSYKASAFSAFQPFFFLFFLFSNSIHCLDARIPQSNAGRTIIVASTGGPLTPLYVALKMPVPAAALTISTMADAAQYQQNNSKSGQARANGGRAKSDGGRGCFS